MNILICLMSIVLASCGSDNQIGSPFKRSSKSGPGQSLFKQGTPYEIESGEILSLGKMTSEQKIEIAINDVSKHGSIITEYLAERFQGKMDDIKGQPIVHDFTTCQAKVKKHEMREASEKISANKEELKNYFILKIDDHEHAINFSEEKTTFYLLELMDKLKISRDSEVEVSLELRRKVSDVLTGPYAFINNYKFRYISRNKAFANASCSVLMRFFNHDKYSLHYDKNKTMKYTFQGAGRNPTPRVQKLRTLVQDYFDRFVPQRVAVDPVFNVDMTVHLSK